MGSKLASKIFFVPSVLRTIKPFVFVQLCKSVQRLLAAHAPLIWTRSSNQMSRQYKINHCPRGFWPIAHNQSRLAPCLTRLLALPPGGSVGQ